MIIKINSLKLYIKDNWKQMFIFLYLYTENKNKMEYMKKKRDASYTPGVLKRTLKNKESDKYLQELTLADIQTIQRARPPLRSQPYTKEALFAFSHQ